MALGYLIDIDGVLRTGDLPIQPAVNFVKSLSSLGIPHLLVTNNSTRTQAENASMLGRLGIKIGEDSILSSSMVVANYIVSMGLGTSAYVVGESGLVKVLESRGIDIVDESPDYVVVGWDRQFTYDKMKAATLMIRAGSKFIATNTDSSFPLPEGIVPGAGAIVASISVATGVGPLVMGKPNPPIFEYSLSKLRMDPSDVVMIGDRYETDILGAMRAGLRSILVTTGISRVDDIPVDGTWPNRIADSLDEVDPEAPL